MPNLAPMNQQQKKLKDNWFSLVPNPDDPEDTAPCIQILEGPFHHVIVRYKNFQLHKKIAKITFPIWLYVAVTGVVVYLMISPYY